jgi:nicotinamidase-related amidase
MTTISLDATSTALVVIDLQHGIAGMPTVPHAGADVVSRAARIAAYFREHHAVVVLVNVDPGPAGLLFPLPITDIERPPMRPTPGWSDLVSELGAADTDIRVTKHQPGAFYGTDLETQLRRRNIGTIVLCGISTNVGVEMTARVAFELGFNIVFVEDAMAARDAEIHTMATTKYFPTIGRVRSTEEVLAAFSA